MVATRADRPDPVATSTVGVVVVTYQSAAVVGLCLNALIAAADGVRLGAVVLVDNDSRDDTINAAREAMPGIVVVASPDNVGYAAAINLGRAQLGPHDVLLVLNPDTALEAGALRRLTETATNPPASIAVPRMTTPDGSLSLSLRRFPTLGSAWAEAVLGGRRAGRLGVGEVVADPRAYEEEHRVDWATGAAVMVPRECWDRLGDWDESYFLYSEETDFMARARTAGVRVTFVPEAVCRHVGGASGSSPELWALLVTNKLRFYRRHHGRASAAAYRLALLFGQGARAVAGDPRARVATKWLLKPVRDDHVSALVR